MTDLPVLDLPPAVRAALAFVARDAVHGERCGFLAGDPASGHVAFVLEAHNARPGAGFSISRAETFRARRAAREANAELLAVFHTHPSGELTLSTADKHSLARSDLTWVTICWTVDGWQLATWPSPTR